MGIQIFGTKKNFDTGKAERFFKERNISCQLVDMKQKGMSRGELQSVVTALKGLENILDPECRDRETLTLIKYLAEEDRFEKVLENQQVIKLPVVRNGKKATVGYEPGIWKSWCE